MDRTVYGARASASHLTLALDSGQCYCTYKVVPRLDAGNATVALRRPRMPSISDLPVLEVVLVGTVTTAADTPRGYPWHMKCCSRIKRREKQRGKRDKSKTEKGREKEEKRNAVQIYRFSHFSHVATHRLVSSTSLLSTSFSAADANARGLFPPATRAFLREREEGQGKSRSVRNTAYTAERTASRSRRFTPTSTACRHRQMDCRVPQNPIVESFPSQKPGLAGPRRGRTPASRSTTTPLPERAALRDLPVQAVWKEGEEFGLGSARSSVGWSWRCGLAGGRGR